MRALILTLGAIVLLSAPSPLRAQEAPEGEAAAAVNPNPLSSLSLDNLGATRSFPLFTPSRTAPVVAEAPVEVEAEPVEQVVVDPEQPPPPLQLVGIVLTESAQTALLLDSGSQEVHRLGTGDEFEGWSLTIVDGRSVEFRSGERVEALRMFESFPAPSSTSAVPEFPPDYVSDEMPVDMPSDRVDQQGIEQVPLEGQPFPAPQPEVFPREGAAPSPEGPPANFDPATGVLPIPEEGPLPAN